MENKPENREMAQAVLDYIHKYPEKHDQAKFFTGHPESCGTTMCVAGTAVYLADGGFNMGHVESRGRELLGLTKPEAEVIFYEMDEERALQKLKKVIVGEAFTKDDFYTLDGEGEEAGLSYMWEDYCADNNIDPEE